MGEPTMIHLAKACTQVDEGRPERVHMPLPADGLKQRKPDITRARNTLGWEPKVQLEDGLKETISYFRNLLAWGRAKVPVTMVSNSFGSG